MAILTVTQEQHYAGLQRWVADYQALRKVGNVKDAKRIRDHIKRVIRQQKLDADRVWGADPDKPL